MVLVNNNAIDPMEVMDAAEMNNDLRRNFKVQLTKNPGESDEKFKERLTAVILQFLYL